MESGAPRGHTERCWIHDLPVSLSLSELTSLAVTLAQGPAKKVVSVSSTASIRQRLAVSRSRVIPPSLLRAPSAAGEDAFVFRLDARRSCNAKGPIAALVSVHGPGDTDLYSDNNKRLRSNRKGRQERLA